MTKELSTKTNLAMDFIEAHTFRYPSMDDVVITEQDAWEAIEFAKKDAIERVCEWLKGNLLYSSKPPYQIIEDLRKAMEE